jgi:hypothetical protein
MVAGENVNLMSDSGVGATMAVFSVVYGVLMNPYPYHGADRMAHLVLKDQAGNDRYIGLTGPQIRQVRKASCIESVLGEDEWNLTTTDEELPEDVVAVYLTPNGARPRSIRCPGRSGSAARGGADLQILAAAL